MADGLDVTPRDEDPNLAVKNRESIADGLGQALADTYHLLYKTHTSHWNVQGPQFYSLHKLLEMQYEGLFAAADTIAERRRALGVLAPLALRTILEESKIEDYQSVPTTREMVEDLASDHERISKSLVALSEEADDQRDPATGDLLNARIAFHDEAAWMLRSTAAQ